MSAGEPLLTRWVPLTDAADGSAGLSAAERIEVIETAILELASLAALRLIHGEDGGLRRYLAGSPRVLRGDDDTVLVALGATSAASAAGEPGQDSR